MLTAFDDLQEDDGDLGWWIDPKDVDPRSEELRQVAVLPVSYTHLTLPTID